MNFLLDTNVVSEWVKPIPYPGVVEWLAQSDEDRLFLSVITLAEIRYGIERMPLGTRRIQLERWLVNELSPRFENRILSIEARIADIWGQIAASAKAAGHTLDSMDAFIAATAVVHDMHVVTCNTAHFESLGTRVINPWLR